MAFKTVNVTLGSGATQVIAVHTPVKQVTFYNDTGNAAVKVGTSAITSTSYGFIVPVSAVATGITGIVQIGPFSGESPFNLDEIWLLGTQNNIIRVNYIT